MSKDEINHTLKTIGSFEDVLNSVSGEDMNVKGVCKVAQRSLKAWGVVMNEFNDVITTLENVDRYQDQIYRAAFKKALEIVMIANKFRGEGTI